MGGEYVEKQECYLRQRKAHKEKLRGGKVQRLFMEQSIKRFT